MKQFFVPVFGVVIFLMSCTQFQLTRNYIFKLKTEGVVAIKYIDEVNHHTKVLKINNFDNSTESIDNDDFKGIWDYAEIYDTIVKKPQSLKILVKKVNGESKEFDYDNPVD